MKPQRGNKSPGGTLAESTEAGSVTTPGASRSGHFARVDPTQSAVVSHNEEFSIAAEHYRNIAFRIEQEARRTAEDGFLVTVTSAEPATGKTLVGLNLALTLARRSDDRILLVEGDLRRPALEDYLQTFLVAPREKQPPLLRSDGPPLGLWHVLQMGIELEEALLPVWGTHLDLLLAGTEGSVENVTAQDRMTELLALLRSRYRIVIFDSPPLILADGRSAAARADRTLVVVRAGRTKRHQIEQALALLDPARTLGLILNSTKLQPEAPYSHYRRATQDPSKETAGEDLAAARPHAIETSSRSHEH